MVSCHHSFTFCCVNRHVSGISVTQKSSPYMGCSLKISSTVRDKRDNYTFVSETILEAELGAVDSSDVVVSSSCAPVVPPVLLSLFSDFKASPFLSSCFFTSRLISGPVVGILC